MNEEKEKDRSLENGQRGEDAAELLKELGLLAGGADFKSDLQYLPIIGSIEGHSILPQDNKTTKYEHVIPELIAVEENPRIRGLLLILNTVGGDVEAGLALAELVAGISKPTVSLVIGGGLALILFATGGTDNPLNYVVLIVSILCMSLFFSIHYLTIYYLLQPYNAGTELKSGTYRIVLSVTYVACFALMQLRMPIMIFGIMTIVFCVLYSIVASILVYRLAPKTFRLRT